MDIRDLLLNASTPEPCFYKKRVRAGKFDYSIHFEMHENLMTINRIKRIHHNKPKKQLSFSLHYERYNTKNVKPVKSIRFHEFQEIGVQTQFPFTSCKDMAVQTVESDKNNHENKETQTELLKALVIQRPTGWVLDSMDFSMDAATQTEFGPVYRDTETQATITTFCNVLCQTDTNVITRSTSMDELFLDLTSSSMPQNVSIQTECVHFETRGVQAKPNVKSRSTQVEQHDHYAFSSWEEPPLTKDGTPSNEMYNKLNELSNELMTHYDFLINKKFLLEEIYDLIHQHGDIFYDTNTKPLLLHIVEELYKATLVLSDANAQKQLISKEPIAARHNAQVIQKHNIKTQLNEKESPAGPSKVAIGAVSLKRVEIKKDIEKRPIGGHLARSNVITKPFSLKSSAIKKDIEKRPVGGHLARSNVITKPFSLKSSAIKKNIEKRPVGGHLARSNVITKPFSLKSSAIKKNIEKRPVGGHLARSNVITNPFSLKSSAIKKDIEERPVGGHLARSNVITNPVSLKSSVIKKDIEKPPVGGHLARSNVITKPFSLKSSVIKKDIEKPPVGGNLARSNVITNPFSLKSSAIKKDIEERPVGDHLARSNVITNPVSLKSSAIKKDIKERPVGGHLARSNVITNPVSLKSSAIKKNIEERPVGGHLARSNVITNPVSLKSSAMKKDIEKRPVGDHLARSNVITNPVSLKSSAIKKDIEKRPAFGHEAPSNVVSNPVSHTDHEKLLTSAHKNTQTVSKPRHISYNMTGYMEKSTQTNQVVLETKYTETFSTYAVYEEKNVGNVRPELVNSATGTDNLETDNKATETELDLGLAPKMGAEKGKTKESKWSTGLAGLKKKVGLHRK